MNQGAAKNMQALMETYQKSGLGPYASEELHIGFEVLRI